MIEHNYSTKAPQFASQTTKTIVCAADVIGYLYCWWWWRMPSSHGVLASLPTKSYLDIFNIIFSRGNIWHHSLLERGMVCGLTVQRVHLLEVQPQRGHWDNLKARGLEDIGPELSHLLQDWVRHKKVGRGGQGYFNSSSHQKEEAKSWILAYTKDSAGLL